jgi:hypothetical protein
LESNSEALEDDLRPAFGKIVKSLSNNAGAAQYAARREFFSRFAR